MPSLKKFAVTAAVVLCAAAAPSVASALPAPDTSVPASAVVQIPVPSAPAAQPSEANSSQGFQFGDAGIGAAVMLLIVSAGAVALVTVRRRGRQHTLVS